MARLRVHGDVVPDWRRLGRGGAEIDLAAAENGGRVLSCSDMFFGVRHNLIMPGRAPNMGDGWETKRRRGPGYDWAILELCAEGALSRASRSTRTTSRATTPTPARSRASSPPARRTPHDGGRRRREILPRTKLQPSTRHFYDDELADRGPFTHVRLSIYPDGGVSRLRLHGAVTRAGGIARRVEWLNALLPHEAEGELLACCGSRAWATEMAARRPFGGLGAVLEAADAVWRGLGREDWLEAFRAHPRIGEKKAEAPQAAGARRWAEKEQAGVTSASAETLAALAEGNRAYDARFGHIYIVCATGRSADEMLALLRARLDHDPATELGVAAEEQRKITRIRLEKLYDP